MKFKKLKQRYQGKTHRILIFGGGYAIVVVLLTLFFRFLYLGVGLENQLFDGIQNNYTIDSKDDWRYKKYKKYLSELAFINLDSSFFNQETNRIDINKLSEMLHVISDKLLASKVVYLDFAYQNRNQNDSFLINEMSIIKEKLILPMSMTLKKPLSIKGKESHITKKTIAHIGKPIFRDCPSGYTEPFVDPKTQINRYYKYRTNDFTYVSAPWLIFSKSGYKTPKIEKYFDNDIKEIDFLLRNRDQLGKERAVLIYEGSDIVKKIIPDKDLSTILKDKIVFIGLFDEYQTKYKLSIDKFTTPVDSKMSGTLLLANAYLNLAIHRNLTSNNWILLLFINFLIGISISLNHEKKISSRYTPIYTTIINFVVSLILFQMIAVFCFLFFAIKLSIGISLLVFQKDYTIYTWYQGFYKKKLN